MDIAVSIFRNILYFASNQGKNLALLCEKIGIDPKELDNPKKNISLEKVENAWKYGTRISKDPLLGLHLGAKGVFSDFGIVGFIMESSPDVATAFERGCHYNSLLSGLVKVKYHQKIKSAVISISPIPLVSQNYALTAKHVVDETMSFVANCVQKLSGKKIVPQVANFTYAPPISQYNEYENIFSADMAFNQNENSLVYDLVQLKTPVIGYNQTLFEMLNDQAEQILNNLSNQDSYANSVKKTIIQLFNQRFPTIELVAETMNSSVQSLQLKLKLENETFQHLLDDIRKEFAIRYMKNKDLTISEVGYLLGFSEISVFISSFKRWTGISPSEFQTN